MQLSQCLEDQMVALNVCLMKKGITINDLNSHHRRSERQTN